MSNPYIGEIRIVGFSFAPVDWALCNGQLLPISQYSAVFELIGTTYGGDGVQTFGLPNLQSRIPLHQGSEFPIGQMGGEESVTLNLNQIPSHTHPAQANVGGGNANSPAGNFWANWTGSQFSNQGAASTLNAGVIGTLNGSQPHENRPPFLALNFIFCLYGIFPSQS